MAFEQRKTAQEQTPKPNLRNSFIRSVGRTVRSYKLGDLLVAARLITRVQLNNALVRQKATGQRLGDVLVSEGYISAVTLYRKLAEQWCIKASTAGMALLMQVMTPSAARADDAGAVRLAAATTSIVRTVRAQPAQTPLFGTTEVKSTNISAFTKWTSAMARFDDQMKKGSSPAVQKWKSHLSSLQHLSQNEKIEQVNSYINSVRYIEDSQNYRKSDYWATPAEFLVRGGDCEDFAIAKYASLRALGFSPDQMRIAIVQDTIKNIPHAILIVYTDNGAVVLDNQSGRVANVEAVNRYRPIFSINSHSWWLHKQPNVS
jgi:predicted transglutaminase-like cysteine proteinase